MPTPTADVPAREGDVPAREGDVPAREGDVPAPEAVAVASKKPRHAISARQRRVHTAGRKPI